MDATIKEALTCAVQSQNEQLCIGILTNFHNNKKIKTLTDTNLLIEHAVYSAAVEENSTILHSILKWNHRLVRKLYEACSQIFQSVC